MAMLDDVKLALRVTNGSFDTEIEDIIEAAKADLTIGGVKEISETDFMVKRAITLYAKANFGMANPDMEKYQKAYDRIKIMMSLASKEG